MEWVRILLSPMQFYFILTVLVKRQLLRYQSPITGLFPVVTSDTEVGSVRESVYCAAAVWGLYQSYRYISGSGKLNAEHENMSILDALMMIVENLTNWANRL